MIYHAMWSFYTATASIVFIMIQINPKTSQRGDKIIEFYRLHVTKIEGFELLDCSEAVGFVFVG